MACVPQAGWVAGGCGGGWRPLRPRLAWRAAGVAGGSSWRKDVATVGGSGLYGSLLVVPWEEQAGRGWVGKAAELNL